MVVGSIESEAWRIQLSENLSNIRVQFRLDGGSDEGLAILGTEDQMNKYRRQRLGHCGFPLSIDFGLSALEDPRRINVSWGVAPGFFIARLWRLSIKKFAVAVCLIALRQNRLCPAIDKSMKE